MSSAPFYLLLVLSAFLAAAAAYGNVSDDGGHHWVVLVAGSRGYENYRHQADICHAYHVVRNNGVPEERIITMMFDDIAYHPENPEKGNIINQPNGKNLYPGVVKDYTKEEVTPDVFMKVLLGDSEGIQETLGRPGKVIKSGPKDRIFVNFADHGARGILAFPTKLLSAKDLEGTIIKMHKKKLYKEMVFYVEACNSGSMFVNFTTLRNLNVYATTAANSTESSFACYLDKERDVFLGDVYSVKWMQDSDKENLKHETLAQQYDIVKSETNTSTVKEYGDLSIAKQPVADFQGTLSPKSLYFTPQRIPAPDPNLDAVPSEMVHVATLRWRIAKTTGALQDYHKAKLEELLKRKADSEEFFERVFGVLVDNSWYEDFQKKPVHFTDFSCYEESLRILMDLCPGMDLTQNDFALRKLGVLAGLCEAQIPPQRVWRAVAQIATQSPICI